MELELNPTACSGFGVCHELLPEVISLDEWGFPVLLPEKTLRTPVLPYLQTHVKHAVAACPRRALRVND